MSLSELSKSKRREELSDKVKETNKIHSISLRYLDTTKYGFETIGGNKPKLKKFDSFIKKVNDGEFDFYRNARKSDKSDKKYIPDLKKEVQILHYHIGSKTNLIVVHGFLHEGKFKLCRIDPNHDFH